ncbi:hypothetical protein DCM91_20375 [Chitinophaga costaii]|nr:hypothetical protein DCM91_20375 [Chitinophaga costaii]
MSCRFPMGGKDNRLMKKVYQNQKSYYDKTNRIKDEYTNIINFGIKAREELYKKYGLKLSELKDFIILEGFNPGWGNFRGILISNKEIYVYKNKETGKWDMELTNIESHDIEKKYIL